MEIAEEIVEVNEAVVNIVSSSKSPDDGNINDPNIWKLVLLRNTRNSYLQLTDKYLLPDFPITEEKRNIIMEYRQYLRNFININQEAIMNGVEIEILQIPIT